MNSRETILGRIREALKVAAPEPGQHEPGVAHLATDPNSFRQWLPLVSAAWDEQCQLFAQNAAMLKTSFKVLPDAKAASAEIQQIIQAGHWRKIATHASPITDAVCQPLSLEILRTDKPFDKMDLEKCDGAVTACEALVAQTGSVLVTSRSCGGRAISILAPHHIVVAAKGQLAPDLPAAFAFLRKKYAGNYPSAISFITGPSRTGDIERILVLGAHGPKQLTVLLLEAENL